MRWCVCVCTLFNDGRAGGALVVIDDKAVRSLGNGAASARGVMRARLSCSIRDSLENAANVDVLDAVESKDPRRNSALDAVADAGKGGGSVVSVGENGVAVDDGAAVAAAAAAAVAAAAAGLDTDTALSTASTYASLCSTACA